MPRSDKAAELALFVSRPADLPDHYLRYLAAGLRDDFDMDGVPIRLMLRKGKIPRRVIQCQFLLHAAPANGGSDPHLQAQQMPVRYPQAAALMADQPRERPSHTQRLPLHRVENIDLERCLRHFTGPATPTPALLAYLTSRDSPERRPGVARHVRQAERDQTPDHAPDR